jgi:ferredoxin-NADP reductase
MKLKLIERKKRFEDVESFIFEPEQPIKWHGGQYMHYVFPHRGEDSRGHERWFTISAPPYEKNLMITTRFAAQEGSSFKKALRAMKIGDTFQADGPKGDFVITDTSKKYILIAGGIGITPYRAILLQQDHDATELKAELLYANRDENFVFIDELRQLEAKHPSFQIHTFVGDHHIDQSDLKPYLDDPSTVFYISGPEPMVEGYEETLQKMGAAKERIFTDFFPGY